MTLSYFPTTLTSIFAALSQWHDKRTAPRVLLLLAGVLFARNCRTVTSWFPAAGITEDWRQAYVSVCAVGRRAEDMAISVVAAVRPLVRSERLVVGIDDMPTQR